MSRRRELDPYFATMEDIMEAAGVTRRTIRVWIERGLLTKPIKVSLGYPSGVFNRFPAHVLEQVRFVAAMREQGCRSTRSPPSSPPGTGPRAGLPPGWVRIAR
jgi:hypothetical protein